MLMRLFLATGITTGAMTLALVIFGNSLSTREDDQLFLNKAEQTIMASEQRAEDAAPFVNAFKTSPSNVHQFQIEQRVGKEIRTSTLSAQIVRIEEGPAETRVLIRLIPRR